MTEQAIRIVLMNEDPQEAGRIGAGLNPVSDQPFEVHPVASLDALVECLTHHAVDAVVMNFLSFAPAKVAEVHRLTQQFPLIPVVVLAPSGDVSLGRALIRAGAEECLGKSETDIRRLSHVICYALERRRSKEPVQEPGRPHEAVSGGVMRFLSDLRKSWTHHTEGMSPQFLALAAHELISPLTAIYGYLSLLLSGQVGDLSESQKEFLLPMKKATHHLTRMVEDLMDLSKIEMGESTMHLKPSDLKMLVEEELVVFRVQAQNKEIHLDETVEDPVPLVLCDRHRMKEVIDNLISNAMKYTPRRGRVHIGIRRAEKGVQLDVADTGIGIRESDLDKVFEPFQHLRKSGLEGETSTGLGLALVKRIVEAHGGQIAVKSREGTGSTFSVILPIHASESSERYREMSP